MATLDLAMPIALLAVTTTALFLNKRVEGRLKTTFEERELRTRDIVLLVVMITVAISVVAFVALLTLGEIFQNILLIVFMFSYSILLFTFSYIFSNMQQKR